MCRSKSVTFVLSQTGIPEIKDTLMQIWKSLLFGNVRGMFQMAL